MKHKLLVFDAVGGVFALIVFVGMLVLFGADSYYVVWSDTTLALAAWAGTAALAWRALRHGPKRKAWVFLAAGLGAEALAETVWWYYEVGRGVDPPFPGGSDVLYLAGYPLLAIGYYMLAPRGISGLTRLQAVLDAIIVSAALLWMSVALVLGPSIAELAGESLLVTAANLSYPVMDLLIAAMALSILSRVPRGGVRPLATLALGLVIWAVGDSAYLLLELRGTYGAGYPTDISWVAGYLTIGSVAFFPDRWFTVHAMSRPASWQRFVPLVLLLAAIALAAWRALTALDVSVLNISLILIVVLGMVGRQALSIRETERLHEATKRAAKSAHALVQHAEDFVALYRPDGRFIFANPAARRATGKSEEVIANMILFDHFHPEDVDRARAAVQQILNDPTEPARMDLRFHAAEDTYRTLSLTATNQLANPDLGGILINARDVTLERRLQQEVMQREASDRLKRERQRLINGASHVLSTPLMPAMLQIAVLSSQKAGPLTETQLRAVASIERNLDRLRRISEGITKAFRLQTEGLAKPARMDIIPAWDRCVARSGLGVVRNGHGGPLYVRADPDLVRQAFEDLLEYLKSAHNEALAPVLVERSSEVVSITIPEPRDHLSDDAAMAFLEPFSRNLEHGAGLELYTCRLALQNQGGDVAWHGGCWVLTLQAAEPEPADLVGLHP